MACSGNGKVSGKSGHQPVPLEPKRLAGNWIEGFKFYTKETEAPDSFLVWTAIFIISAALERRVFTHWGYFKYYPNMYMLFVAPAGCRKSTAMRFAKHFLAEAKVPTSSDTLSREMLIEQMIERGRDAQALGILSDEFMHFIQTSGANMITMLTEMYDCPDNWEYGTKKRSTETIPAPYLCLLGGLIPHRIRELDPRFIESGLASRTVLIVEDTPRFRRARPAVTNEMLKMREALIADLMHIVKNVKGEMRWTVEAEDWFTHWYENTHFAEETKAEVSFQGYYSRKPTQLVRLAQIMSIAESDETVIEKGHLLSALGLLESAEGSMLHLFGAMGRNPLAGELQRIADEITAAGGLSKKEIVRRHTKELREDELDEVLNQLTMMGVVRLGNRSGEPWLLPVKENKDDT